MRLIKQSVLPALAIAEWLLLLPPAVLVAAAALRSLQPAQYEPARTGSLILEWTAPRLSHPGAAFLFLGLPALVAVLGCVALHKAWRRDANLRNDFAAVLAILERSPAIVVLLAATVIAGSILAFAVVHVIAD